MKMADSPSTAEPQKSSTIHASQDAVGIQCDPRAGKFSAGLMGQPAVSIGGTLVFIFMVFWKWQLLGQCALPTFLILLVVFIVLVLKPRFPIHRVHITRRTLTLEGVSQAALMKGGMVDALTRRMFHLGSLSLPEPDAMVEASTGQVIQFKPGQKEKLLAEQKDLETKAAQITQTMQSDTEIVKPDQR